MDQQEALREWIARGLEKPGKLRSQLAHKLGLAPSAVTRMLDGTRRVRLDELPRIAAYLGEAPPLDMPGLEEDGADYEQPTIPVKGYVGAGAVAHYLPLADDELDRVPAIEGSTPSTIALEIRGTSLGELFDRWLVYFDQVRTPVTPDLVGKTCVVGLADGRILVKKLKRAKNGLFDLHSNTEAPIEGVVVEWAARVKIMAPR